MSDKDSNNSTRARTFSLIKTLGSTAVKAGGEAMKKKIFGESENPESAAAVRLAKGLDDLKGAAMKLGQMLSLSPDDDLLPKTWKMALSKLQAEATPKDWPEILPILNDAFPGGLPFLSIEEKAVHAASIGQVHKAVLKDGTAVAVKVRYPNLEGSVKSDIEGMRKVLKLANILPSKNSYDDLAKTVEELLMQELDFERERKFYEMYFEKLKDSKHFLVPRVRKEACASSVLTTEWIEGESVDKWLSRLDSQGFHETQDERNKIGELVFELLYLELFVFGKLQTDPNPANFLVLKDGRIALLDFGATQELSPMVHSAYRSFVIGTLYGKPGEISRAAAAIGFLQRSDNETIRDSFMQMMKLIGEPFKNEAYSWRDCGLAKRVREEAMRYGVLTKFRAPPSEIVFVNRRVLGTQLMLENIGPTFQARAVAERYTSQ